MKNQIKYGAVLAYINLFVKTAAQLIYIPLLVRTLGQQEYGIYTLALGIASYLTVLNLGIDSSYIHFFAKTKREGDQEQIYRLNASYLVLFCFLGMIALATGILVAMLLKYFFSGFTVVQIDSIRKMLLILTVNVALSFPLGLMNSYAVAHEKHVVVKSIALVTTALNPVLSIIALRCGGGAIWVVAVMVATNLLPQFVLALYAVIVLKFKVLFHRKQYRTIRAILAFSGLVFLQIVAEQANWNIDKILLGHYQNPESIAVYGTGAQIQSLYMMVALAISGLFTPRVHRLVAEGANKEVDKLFRKVGNIQFFVVGLVLSGFILFGRQFINLWVGSAYDTSYVIALLLMVPATVDLIQNTGIEIQRAMGLQKDRAVVYFCTSVLNLLISIPLCQQYGGVGCAIGTAIAFVLCNVVYMNVYYQKKMCLSIGRFWKMIAQKAIPVGVLSIIGYFVSRTIKIDNYYTLILCILVYSLAYTAIYLGIDRYTREDKDVSISR